MKTVKEIVFILFTALFAYGAYEAIIEEDKSQLGSNIAGEILVIYIVTRDD